MTILDRLRRAETGSRELDAMIAVSLQIMPSNAFQPCASDDPGTFGTGAYTFWTAPEYTTSIDAAVALVERMLPGALWRVQKCPTAIINQNIGAYWATAGMTGEQEAAYGATPALAIVTALFTAIEAKEAKA